MNVKTKKTAKKQKADACMGIERKTASDERSIVPLGRRIATRKS